MLAPAHVEIAAAVHKSIEYCKKEGNWIEEGEPPIAQEDKGAKEKERWRDIRKLAEEGRLSEIPDDVFCRMLRQLEYVHNFTLRQRQLHDVTTPGLWLWGAPNTGKSRFARSIADPEDTYVKLQNKWWDNYKAQRVVIIDDVHPTLAKVLTTHLKHWLDRYPFPVEFKGGVITVRPELMVITSNYHPRQCFEGVDFLAIMRRIDVYEFFPDRDPQKTHTAGDPIPPNFIAPDGTAF